MLALPDIVTDKRGACIHIFFLFLHENICCGYSLEVPHWGASNEYHNICSCGEIRKISAFFGWKKHPICWYVIYRFDYVKTRSRSTALQNTKTEIRNKQEMSKSSFFRYLPHSETKTYWTDRWKFVPLVHYATNTRCNCCRISKLKILPLFQKKNNKKQTNEKTRNVSIWTGAPAQGPSSPSCRHFANTEVEKGP